MFARRHLDFLAEPFDISSRLVDAIWRLPTPLARALVDEGVTRLTERASFLASQKLQPAPGAMRFARRAAQQSSADQPSGIRLSAPSSRLTSHRHALHRR